jgi:Ca-activated chloride channel family protein
MSFAWPDMLWLLALLPALAWAYRHGGRARHALASRHPGLRLETPAGTSRLRAALAPLLLLAAIAAAIVGLARPQAAVVLPSQQQVVLLALDVSLSMRARDVEPDRFTAARAAARAFVEQVPDNVRVGIIAFAGTATVVQAPTTRRDELLAAIERLTMQRGTATGSALVLAMATLFPDHGIDLEAMLYGGAGGGAGPGARAGQAARADKGRATPAFVPVEPGSYRSAAVILLSDGRRTTGVDPVAAARLAAERGVRVYTVGIGTVEGGAVDFGGMSMYMRLDEEALKMMASMTAGEYRYAATADDLRKVYEGLGSQLVLERQHTEVTFAFAALAALLALAGAGLSLWRTGRIA